MFGSLKEIWASLEEKERTYLKSGLQFILLIGGLSIFVLPFLFTRNSFFEWMDFSKTGEIGDTINGISTPFITLLGALLTFLAFYIQFKANVQQREQFTEQLKLQKDQLVRELDAQKQEKNDNEKKQNLERFETKYYELIRLHRANVDEIDIAGVVTRRKAFAAMYDEYRFIYFFLESQASKFKFSKTDKKDKTDLKIDDHEKMSIVAYLIFYYGIGVKSNPAFFDSLVQYCSVLFIHQLALKISLNKMQYRKRGTLTIKTHIGKNYKYPGKYTPFDGHSARLGHYYRHLFQTVKFVNDTTALEGHEQRYEYLKILRAQLSDYEQVMLYYNALSPMGQPWLDDDKPLLIPYKMIKNIPLHLVNTFGLNPEIKFEKEIELLRNKKPPEQLFESREFEKKKD